MQHKKIVFCLSVALLLALTSCGKPVDTQEDTPSPTPTAVTDYEVPDVSVDSGDTVTSGNHDEQNIEDEAYIVALEDLDPIILNAFKMFYNTLSTREAELVEIKNACTLYNLRIPDNLSDLYSEWISMQAPETAETPAAPLFEEVNETVYTTTDVNIRASYSENSKKVATLAKGGSVTRTGIGQGEADGWSRVELTDPKGNLRTLYIATDLLSTTKPSTTTQSQGGSTGGGKGGSTTQDSTQTPGGTQGGSGGSTSTTNPGTDSDGVPLPPGYSPDNRTQEEINKEISDMYNEISKPGHGIISG